MQVSPIPRKGPEPCIQRSAGTTGLFKILCEDYLSTLLYPGSISWVRNISRNTQLALLRGYINVAFTYEREQEQIAANEGWSETVGCVFGCYFCLAGPVADPANVHSATSFEDALKRIAASKAPFYSRIDFSTSCRQERQYWKEADLTPWEELEPWYITTMDDDPPTALRNADALGAYVFTDRSSVLGQTARGAITNTTVFIEPKDADDPLVSSCHASHNPAQMVARRENVDSFLRYLLSSRGQDLIASFGDAFVGAPLFVPAHIKFDSSKVLAGGRPSGQHWVYTKEDKID